MIPTHCDLIWLSVCVRVNAVLYSVRAQDVIIGKFCSVQHCLVTPALLHSTFFRPFSHGSLKGVEGVSKSWWRKLRMRRLHCATSVAPCRALVSSALALYRWLQPHRQVYRFIPAFFSLFFPVPFSTRTASETVSSCPPPPSNWCSQVELHASSRPFGELLEIATVEWLSGRVHLMKVECVKPWNYIIRPYQNYCHHNTCYSYWI